MGLADALEAQRHSHRGPRCSVCALVESMSKQDREAFDAALADEGFTGAAIARALKAEGLADFQAQTIQRHRTGVCRRDTL